MANRPISALADSPVTNWALGQTVMPTDMNNIGQFITNCETTINAINVAFDSLMTFAGGSLTGAIKEAPIKALTTSGTVNLTGDSNVFSVTGIGPITSVTGWSQGIAVIMWGSPLTLTNGANLALKGGSHNVVNGDVSFFTFNGSVATELVFMPSAGWASQFLPFSGGNLTGAINETAVTLASASTMNIGAAGGNCINVTGTNTITAFDVVQAGTRRKLRFGGALTLNYNATSLILPGAQNLAVSAGDVVEFLSLGGGNWCISDYQPAALLYTNSNLPPSFRNKIINGDMRDDQRNSGNSLTITSSAAYTIDRFYASASGANVTGQRVAGTLPFAYAYKLTGAASNTGTVFGQKIEAANAAELVNQQATGQVQLSSSTLTSITWTAYSANSADNFSAKIQIATGTLTINSTPTEYTFSFNAGTNAANGISIEFTSGALLATQTLTYSGIQIEKGAVTTPFEFLPRTVQAALCRRYYRTGNLYINGYAGSGMQLGVLLPFDVLMRAAPTVGVVAGTYTNASSLAAGTVYPEGVICLVTITSGGVGSMVGGSYTATAEL